MINDNNLVFLGFDECFYFLEIFLHLDMHCIYIIH